MAKFGTESCFNTINTEYNAVAVLDSTHVVVAYKDTGGSGYGCAKVGVIAADTVTWGAELCFNSAVTDWISITALDSTHFVVSYRDDGGDDYGCARVGLVSGTTISSYGTENIFSSSDTIYTSINMLDSTHFVIAYRDNGNSQYGTAIAGSVSGTTISYGSANVFNSAQSSHVGTTVLDSTHFVACYYDGGNSGYGTAIVGSISGVTISYGAENVFNAASTSYMSTAALDSTHFVVSYHDGGNSNYGTSIVGLVSGVTISSYGAENVYNSATTYHSSASALDGTHFVVSYTDGGNSNYGTSIVGLVSGTTISSYGDEIVFNSTATEFISMAVLSSTDCIVVYKDGGGDDYGCSRIFLSVANIGFGTESCFNTVNTEYTAVATLDPTHVVVAYKDTGGSGYGCAKIGVIDSNVVTWGAELCFNSAVTGSISIASLDSTHFIVGYQDDGDADYGCAKVGAVSGGTTISYGAENIFNSGVTDHISVSALDSSHFVISFRDRSNSNYGTALIGLVSGTTITSYGAKNVFNSAPTTGTSISMLDSTHFVIGYQDGGNAYYGTAIVGVVSGVTITSYGTENVFNSGSVLLYHNSIYMLDSTHFVIGYGDGGNSSYGTAIVGLVSGVSITSYGAKNVFNTDAVAHTSVSTFNSSSFAIVYRDGGNSFYGTAIIGSVSGTTIDSYGSKDIFNSVFTSDTSCVALNQHSYIVVYKDTGGANYGCSRVFINRELGIEACFNEASTGMIDSVMLDDTHVVVVYKNKDGSLDYGCAKVGVISGNDVTWGDESVFNSASTTYVGVTALDSTHFVVAYKDDGGSDFGIARVGTVSGTTISGYGAEASFNDAITDNITIDTLDSTHFIVAFRNGLTSSYGTVRIGLVSGSSISYGTASVFNAASTTSTLDVSRVDSTHFAVAYRDSGGSSYGCSKIGVYSGTTVSSYGSEVVFNAAATTYINISMLNSDHVIVTFSDAGNSDYATAMIGSISGTVITYGAESVFNAGDSFYVSSTALDSSHFVAVYRDHSNSGCGTLIEGIVSGTTIVEYGSEQIFNDGITNFPRAVQISAAEYIVVYVDDGADGYGCARVWSGDEIPPTGWSGTIIGVSDVGEIISVEIANITSVIGVS